MAKFLDKDVGLPYFWQQLKTKLNGKVSSIRGVTSGLDGAVVYQQTYDGTNYENKVAYVAGWGNKITKPTNATTGQFLGYDGQDWVPMNAGSGSTENCMNKSGSNASSPLRFAVSSFNEGSGTCAKGSYSHAEGYGSTANGNYSHAEGYGTCAWGAYTHAEGCNTRAISQQSHSEGYATSADGQYSHAEGTQTCAKGSYSHTEGYGTFASASGAHAEGVATTADSSGNGPHAEGWKTYANGNGAHAEGVETIADYEASHAEGYQTSARSTCAHAEGSGTCAKGGNSHAEGSSTYAYGSSAHAEGYSTTAYGNGSHAEGYSTCVYGTYAHAEGYSTCAYGGYSHAEGYNTYSGGTYSHAEGYMTSAYGRYSHAEGCNTGIGANAYYAHVSGMGTCVISNTNNYGLFVQGIDLGYAGNGESGDSKRTGFPDAPTYYSFANIYNKASTESLAENRYSSDSNSTPVAIFGGAKGSVEVNSKGDIYSTGMRFKARGVISGILKANSHHKIYIPQGSIYLLAVNSCLISTSAFRGANVYTLITNGGGSAGASTSVLATPKLSSTFGGSGTVGISTTLGADTSGPGGYSDGNYTGYITIGSCTTNCRVEYAVIPLLTRFGEF